MLIAKKQKQKTKDKNEKKEKKKKKTKNKDKRWTLFKSQDTGYKLNYIFGLI